MAYLVPRQAAGGSCALLVGADRYDHWDDLPGVRRNLEELAGALVAGHAFAPQQVTSCRPEREVDFLQHLQEAVERARGGVLLLYFAGHGRLSRDGGELYLMLRQSRPSNGELLAPYAEAVNWHHTVFPRLHDAVTHGTATAPPVRRIVVVLDCCNAGNALSVFDPGTVSAGGQRITVLAAVQVNRRIAAGDDHGPTPYTAALVDLLRHGVTEEATPPAAGQPVCAGPLAEALVRRMAGHHTHEGDRWVPRHHLAEKGPDVLLGWTVGDPPGPGPTPAPTPRPPWWHRYRRLLAGALAGALAVLAAAGAVALVDVLRGTHRCPVPTEVRLLTDPDTAPSLRYAVTAFLRSDENHDADGCRRSGVTVTAAKSTDVVTALRRSWRPASRQGLQPQRDLGAQPDVWIPGSTTALRRVKQDGGTARNGAHPRLEVRGNVAYTPVVLSVPDALALPERLWNSHATLAALTDALAERNRGEDPVVLRADPEHTEAAQLATAALYGLGDGGAPVPTATVRRIEEEADLLAPSPRNAYELLCTLDTSDRDLDRRAAVLVPEHVVLQRTANPHRLGCAVGTPTGRRSAYPSDTHWLDLPFVHVRWPSADRDEERRTQAVRSLGDWLTSEAGQAVLAEEGYWTADPEGGELRRPAASMPTLERFPGEVPPAPLEAAAVDRALRLYRTARGPGQVLYLLDRSGSMRQQWAVTGGAVDLLTQSLRALGPEDEYGIWTVAGAGHQEFRRLGRHRESPERVRAALAEQGTVARDSDPATALERALAELAEHGGDGRPQQLVLVTDNEDVNQYVVGKRRGKLLDTVARRGVPLVVVSLRTAGCGPDETVHALAQASGGRCLDASEDLAAALQNEVARVGTGDAEDTAGDVDEGRGAPSGGRKEDDR